MKKLLFILLGLPLFISAQSQQNINQNFTTELNAKITDGSLFLQIQDKQIQHETLTSNLNSLMNLNQDYSFKNMSDNTDKLGYTHFKYQQYYKGIEIDGGLLLIHSKNGLVTSINGKVAEFDNLDIQATISKNDAENIAKNSLGVSSLTNQHHIKKVIVWNKKDKEKAQLAYKIRVESLTPFLMYNVFVDAKSGEIVKKISLIANSDVIGSAKTHYDGLQIITCDSFDSFQIGSNTYGIYRLRESSNNRKIETYSGIPQEWGGPTYDIINMGNPYFKRLVEPGTYTFNMYDSGWDGWEGASVQIYAGSTNITASLSFGGSASETFTVNSSRDSIMIAFWYAGWGNSQNEISWELIGPDNISISSGGYGDVALIKGLHGKNCAPSVHWAMEETYDYFLEIHSRDSYNDSGAVIKSYVDVPGFLVNNAMASNGKTFYGIGDGIQYDYWVSLDLIGHEYTHNVITYNGNGGLNYQNESGALNESFADIFGTCIEHHSYSLSNKTPNFDMFEDVCLIANNVRSMQEPKLSNSSPMPDTYGGEYWHDFTQPGLDTLDNGGVHINNGVQNKWFYLLCEGGYGINDNSLQYNLDGIGIAKAEQIAYRNLIYYLTPDATYQDAFDGSVEAAIDLYGAGSSEYNAVINAWYAVGVFGSSSGCMDPTACNYNPLALSDDGSCDYSCYGCTDETACNYNSEATIDDNSCNYSCYGCTEETACNYNSAATIDDGSCYDNVIASIMQDGDNLMAVTTPVGLNANWYNIQTEDTLTKIWLMQEDASSFNPRFECSYFITISDMYGCIDTSEIYYFGANASRIGALTTSPNPTSGLINVQFNNDKNQYVYLHLINSNGTKLDDFITKGKQLDIDLSKYPAGTYYLHFNSSDSKQGCNAQEAEKISTKIILTK